MAMQAMWVHGSSAQIFLPEGTDHFHMVQVGSHPWTDLTGTRGMAGAMFRGRGGNGNAFSFSIPTPVVRFGTVTGPRTQPRCSLLRVFVLYTTGPGVVIQKVQASDGAQSFIDSRGSIVGRWDVGLGGDFSGVDVRNEAQLSSVLVDRRTSFSIPIDPHVSSSAVGVPVFWGVCIQLDVSFSIDGDITFMAAGADFNVQDS